MADDGRALADEAGIPLPLFLPGRPELVPDTREIFPLLQIQCCCHNIDNRSTSNVVAVVHLARYQAREEHLCCRRRCRCLIPSFRPSVRRPGEEDAPTDGPGEGASGAAPAMLLVHNAEEEGGGGAGSVGRPDRDSMAMQTSFHGRRRRRRRRTAGFVGVGGSVAEIPTLCISTFCRPSQQLARIKSAWCIKRVRNCSFQ